MEKVCDRNMVQWAEMVYILATPKKTDSIKTQIKIDSHQKQQPTQKSSYSAIRFVRFNAETPLNWQFNRDLFIENGTSINTNMTHNTDQTNNICRYVYTMLDHCTAWRFTETKYLVGWFIFMFSGQYSLSLPLSLVVMAGWQFYKASFYNRNNFQTDSSFIFALMPLYLSHSLVPRRSIPKRNTAQS